MRFWVYVARRVVLLLPVLLGVSLVTFTITNVFGNPIAGYIDERTPEAQVQQIIQEHGFDKPIYVQYFYYIRALLSGDWGRSRSLNNRPVIDAIRDFWPATFELTTFALVITLLMGIPLGIISATHQDKPLDHVSRIFSLTGVSMPIFWLGLLMLIVFYYQFKILGLPSLPGGGRINQFLNPPFVPTTGFFVLDSIIQGRPDVFVDVLAHLILPGVCLAYHGVTMVTRMMRSSMLEVMHQDYIVLARSKGLSERIVIYKHALRNAMIPTVTIVGISVGGLLTGAAITETVFSWPGLGRWAASAIISSDVAAIAGFAIVSALVYVAVNLIVDITYALIDPRIRLG